jgi:hypothetical protein
MHPHAAGTRGGWTIFTATAKTTRFDVIRRACTRFAREKARSASARARFSPDLPRMGRDFSRLSLYSGVLMSCALVRRIDRVISRRVRAKSDQNRALAEAARAISHSFRGVSSPIVQKRGF